MRAHLASAGEALMQQRVAAAGASAGFTAVIGNATSDKESEWFKAHGNFKDLTKWAVAADADTSTAVADAASLGTCLVTKHNTIFQLCKQVATGCAAAGDTADTLADTVPGFTGSCTDVIEFGLLCLSPQLYTAAGACNQMVSTKDENEIVSKLVPRMKEICDACSSTVDAVKQVDEVKSQDRITFFVVLWSCRNALLCLGPWAPGPDPRARTLTAGNFGPFPQPLRPPSDHFLVSLPTPPV